MKASNITSVNKTQQNPNQLCLQNNEYHTKKIKENSDDLLMEQSISKTNQTIEEQIAFIFPTLSNIGELLAQAENNINKGIDLMKHIKAKETSKGSDENSITKSKKKVKRNHLQSLDNNNIVTTSVLPKTPINEEKAMDSIPMNIPSKSIIKHETPIKDTLSFEKLPHVESEVDQIINELKQFSSKEDLKKYLINKFPLLAEYSSIITRIPESNNNINELQSKLISQIESNQILKSNISSNYIEYAKLKEQNEQYKAQEDNAIQKLKEYQSDINHLEDVLQTEKFKANTLHEKLKVAYQSESILSLESPTEGEGF